MEDSTGVPSKSHSTQGYNAAAVKRAKKSSVVDEIDDNVVNWHRPALEPFNPSSTSIAIQQIETDYYIMEPAPTNRNNGQLPSSSPEYSASLNDEMDNPAGASNTFSQSGRREAVIRIFGVTLKGNSVTMHVRNFHAYFYVPAWPNMTEAQMQEFGDRLNDRLLQDSRVKGLDLAVLRVSPLEATSVWGYQHDRKSTFLKLTLVLPTLVAPAKRILEEGILVGGESRQFQTYESNVPYVLRYMIDAGMAGGSWVEAPAGTYMVRSAAQCDTLSQLEVDVDYNQVVSHESQGEWLQMAPLRVLSFDIECAGRRGHFPTPDIDPVIQIASCLSYSDALHRPVHKVVHTLNTCAAIPGADVVSSMTEEELLMRWKEHFLLADPDVVIGYNIINFDFPYLIDRAKTLKLPNFPFLGRVKGVETRVRNTTFASRAIGKQENKELNIEGRVQFDVLVALRRDYKLVSYTLNAVSAEFLKQQKEDVHHSIITDLQNGTDETRRRLAEYCLKDALLPLRLMNKLMLLVNYVEMARVTGVPIMFLLQRGQSIKVISQILRKARQHGMLVPVVRKGSSEDQYEGATVIEPMRGYYADPIATLDFASLYPSIMMAHNLCYSTLISASEARSMPAEQYTKTPNGDYFVKDAVKKGLLPEILDELLRARKAAKREMGAAIDPFTKAVLNGRQLALKISANCFPADHQILTEEGFMDLPAVQRHFTRHDTLSVACYVDGQLQYHAITEDKLTVATGAHDLVHFTANTAAGDGVDLRVTANHRMYARVGAADAEGVWRCEAGQSPDAAVPAFQIISAGEIVAAGARDVSCQVQFQATCPGGVAVVAGDLPVAKALQLQSDAAVSAFLELYGHWLGSGCLDNARQAVVFTAHSTVEAERLLALCVRAGVRTLSPEECSTGTEGVFVAPSPAENAVSAQGAVGAQTLVQCVHVRVAAWWDHFTSQHTHTVLGEEAKTADAPETQGVASAAQSIDVEVAATGKQLPAWVWTHLDKQQLRCLLVGLSTATTATDSATAVDASADVSIHASSRALMEAVVRLATHAGYTACPQLRTQTGDAHTHGAASAEWVVRCSETAHAAQPTLSVATECHTSEFHGTVWCVTVPVAPNLIIVRAVHSRAGVAVPGRAMVVGNSVYGFTGAQVGQLPCLAISSSVTAFGRVMIEHTKATVEKQYTKANGYEHDAVVIYGDTDSVMVKFGTQDIKEAMRLGLEAAGVVSKEFVSPIKLEFEKVYWPYLLMNKKRYAGLYWTRPDQWDKIDTKGIETVRRDNCALVKNVVTEALETILVQRSPQKAIENVKRYVSDLLCNRLDLSLLVISKSLGKGANSTDYAAKQAHVELAERMRKRDPTSAPMVGDRVPFVIVKAAKGAPMYEKSEDPLHVLENDMPIDTDYYLEHQLKKPLERIFEPILGSRAVQELFEGDHTLKVKITTATGGAGIMKFAKKTETCLGCRVALPAGRRVLCVKCEPRRAELYVQRVARVREQEESFGKLWAQCQRCQGSVHEEVLCTSRDCPIFYRRKKVQIDLNEVQTQIDRFSM